MLGCSGPEKPGNLLENKLSKFSEGVLAENLENMFSIAFLRFPGPEQPQNTSPKQGFCKHSFQVVGGP